MRRVEMDAREIKSTAFRTSWRHLANPKKTNWTISSHSASVDKANKNILGWHRNVQQREKFNFGSHFNRLSRLCQHIGRSRTCAVTSYRKSKTTYLVCLLLSRESCESRQPAALPRSRVFYAYNVMSIKREIKHSPSRRRNRWSAENGAHTRESSVHESCTGYTRDGKQCALDSTFLIALRRVRRACVCVFKDDCCRSSHWATHTHTLRILWWKARTHWYAHISY